MQPILFATMAIALAILFFELKKFRSAEMLPALAFPVAVFTLGFSLRLSGNQASIDLGFFFTEFSLIFVYVLFTAALLLGQVKYWKIR